MNVFILRSGFSKENKHADMAIIIYILFFMSFSLFHLLTIDIGSQETVVVGMSHDFGLDRRSRAAVVVIAVVVHEITQPSLVVVVGGVVAVEKKRRAGTSITVLVRVVTVSER